MRKTHIILGSLILLMSSGCAQKKKKANAEIPSQSDTPTRFPPSPRQMSSATK